MPVEFFSVSLGMQILKKLWCFLTGHKYIYVCDLETPGLFFSKIWCPRCNKIHSQRCGSWKWNRNKFFFLK